MDAKELFGHWGEVRDGLISALDVLADEQLDFTPREGLWSLGTVARHIASAEEGWFRYVIGRSLTGWPEYAADDYPTVESVTSLLAGVHARTEGYLVTVATAQLQQPVKSPWGPEFPLQWIIWHVLEHEIHHRGEIFLMLGLLGIEAPDV